MQSSADGFFAASDIGGTFTDTVVADSNGAVRRFKAPTTPDDLVRGVLSTFELAAGELGLSVQEFIGRLRVFSHGTTVATNALIERRGARTGVIHTAGFGDTLFIMRGYKGFGLDEDELKDFRHFVKKQPLLGRELVREVSERVDARGRVLIELDEAGTRVAIRELVQAGVDSIAVCLLWCTAHPAHEQRVAELIREEAPHIYVSTSSEVLARINEYARGVTTVVNAYLGPLVSRVTASITGRLTDEGLAHEPLLMQSNGGVTSVSRAGEHPVSFLLSGPVGGVVGSRYVADTIREPNVVTTDMGGTSFDVGLVVDGRPLLQSSSFIDNQPIGIPTVAVETVGAGGGSIARVEGGALMVGPTSAGAVPGPACYGAGGTEPTVTDADVVLGLINPDSFLGGRKRLDRDAAVEAVRSRVAVPLGITVEDAAEGIKRIVDARMADLIRTVTVHKGFDPREFALVAFGGAGPVHAYSYGAGLGVKKIIVPVTASVHSAFGILASDLVVTRELSRSFMTPAGTSDAAPYVDASDVNAIVGTLERDAVALLEEQGLGADDIRIDRFVDMHFRFQIHELTVEIPHFPLEPPHLDLLVQHFVRDYELRFGEGSAFTAAGVEFVNWRVVATGRLSRPAFRETSQSGGTAVAPIRRDRMYEGGWQDADVYDEGALQVGAHLNGPAIVEMKDTNIVIGPGQVGNVDDHGNVVITPRT
ncbi:hydantoinase/oxoprolinase family protein [Baekduia soli]|uniref:Hydantoinase/oxoprolinase family protein n=1 Tax=Baekduia soli TaxID=496014 RepID=A0A5B8U319_9ACTN|nr:hydantoinase/oxoprolinase family protein [Baekduia soli]QEC47426.1 hydantoinase/oxoprolinase family protein [Baekduia soli]